MPDRIITLCYRKIIDVNSARPWEKLVFEDTYTEFRMHAQLLNPTQQYHTFGQLLQFAPGADRLHFLVSAAARGYLQQLNGLVPDILDNLGRHFLRFTKFQFEIINSDLRDKSRHQVGINFYSEPLVWHYTIGPHLLVSEKQEAAGEVLTSMFQFQPFLTIYSLQTAA